MVEVSAEVGRRAVRRGVERGERMQQRLSRVVWIGDRAPEAVVHEWFWQPQGVWVASRGFCSSCEMRVGAVEARCVRAASPTHALERGVLSRSPSAAERRSATSLLQQHLNNNICPHCILYCNCLSC